MTLVPLLHCNDVYRVTQTDSKGNKIGADQFAYKVQKLREQWPKTIKDESQDSNQKDGLMLFSGDVFSPSVESSVTRGVHMIPILKEMKVDCAVLGK